MYHNWVNISTKLILLLLQDKLFGWILIISRVNILL